SSRLSSSLYLFPPALGITCPPISTASSSSVAVSFSHSLRPAGFPVAHWSIDYGDGRSFEGGPGQEAAVFSHTYRAAGSYIAKVTVTGENGSTGFSNCVFSWFKPYVPPSSSHVPSVSGYPSGSVWDPGTGDVDGWRQPGIGGTGIPDDHGHCHALDGKFTSC
ncbi:MAG: PKD domain-containing protein, partial [Actinobacteria bacterium]|nr:PKD domain-containing protein [Actinomycetota bacterium]